MKKKTTEQDLVNAGYDYLGPYGQATRDREPNQLWRKHDELIIYDPEEERIIWSQFNEPRYQTRGGM